MMADWTGYGYTTKTYEELRAERDRLREALERIIAKDYDMRNPWHETLQIAREALGPGSEGE